MKARILALLALVLGVVSCQTEPEGLDVNVGGEVETTVCVSLPEATRANSAVGAVGTFNNVDWNTYTVRYIMQIFDQNGRASEAEYVAYKDGNEDNNSVTFPVRLVPNRDYNFVVWADIVTDAGKTDLHYNLHNGDEGALDLTNITLNDTWVAMDETRDAYTGFYNTEVEGTKYSSKLPINITLTRPFAKLRVITTDMVELGHLGIVPHNAVATYTTKFHKSFNAYNGEYGAETDEKTHTFNYADVTPYTDQTSANKVLFTDYFFADDSDVVKFILDVKEENGTSIKENNFNTDIAVRRNYLTTISGNILTDGNNVKVTVDDIFANYDENGNLTNPDYDYATISSEAEFFAAVNGNGGQYILISDIDVDGVYASTNAATRTSTNKTVNINLNGKTITVNNDSTDALISLADGAALIFSGEGTITGSGKLAGDDANVVVTDAVAVDSDVTGVKTGLEALVYICENGGEFTFANDLSATEVVWVKTTNPVVINGNNFNLTSSANRIVRIEKSNAVVTFNDVNFISSAVATYLSDARGVSIDPQLSNVALTLNNCSIDFTDKTANDWTYAVNVSGNGTGHKVTVNGGIYEGANVVNAHGAKNTIVVKNATLNCLYPNNDQYYGACIWVLQNQESSVYAEGNTFNGNNAIAFNLGTGTVLEEKNNTDNTKYVAAKVGDAYYYNIAEAIAAAENGATVKVLQSHACNEPATVAGKAITLDLNGKTITGTDSSTGSYALITNKGDLTITGNGKMTLKAENNREWNAYSSVISNTVGGKLVVENGTIEHLGGTDMAYGIDNLTNGKGTYAETVINGGTIKSTYRAVRMFLNGIEAQNLLTVNGGTIEGANKSIWMQDPSKNANTGTLVVNEGATLKGDVYLFVTAGSTSWPVEVSIAASAVKGEVLTGNVPVGYEVVLENGVWTVVAYEKVAEGLYKNGVKYLVMNAEGLATLNTMMKNQTAGTYVVVKLAADIDFAGKTWTPVDSHADSAFYLKEINGQGHTISNLTINGQAMFTRFAGFGDVTIKDITFDNATVTSNTINTSILTVQTYQNVLLDNVDVKNSSITGGYKVAPLIGTVYNESASTITATLKNCDVENVTVKATVYDFCTTGLVAFVYEGDNDRITFENCTVKDVKLMAPKNNGYSAHAAIYVNDKNTDDLINEAEGVIVENVNFEEF